MARVQLKLRETSFQDQHESDQIRGASLARQDQAPPFLPERASFAPKSSNRLFAVLGISAFLIVAPAVIGWATGYPIAGLAISTIVLLGVGLLTFGFWVLDNTPYL